MREKEERMKKKLFLRRRKEKVNIEQTKGKINRENRGKRWLLKWKEERL